MLAMDFSSWLLAKHAQHVVLVPFPIALFITGVAFDITARGTKRMSLEVAAHANLAAAAFVPLVLVTGTLAWRWQLLGQKLRGVLLLHRVLGSWLGGFTSGPGEICQTTASCWNYRSPSCWSWSETSAAYCVE